MTTLKQLFDIYPNVPVDRRRLFTYEEIKETVRSWLQDHKPHIKKNVERTLTLNDDGMSRGRISDFIISDFIDELVEELGEV